MVMTFGCNLFILHLEAGVQGILNVKIAIVIAIAIVVSLNDCDRYSFGIEDRIADIVTHTNLPNIAV